MTARARVRVCFVSWALSSLIDPSLPPRYGGAELQMWLLATELSKDPELDVHLMVDELPATVEPPPGITFHVFPRTIRRGIPGISAVLNAYVWVWALSRTGCSWYVQMSAGALTGMVALARVILRKRMAFLLSSDGDVEGSILQKDPRALRWYLWARRHADVVFAQHTAQQAELASMGIAAELLPSGFRVSDTLAEQERDIVLWVASCQPIKQPELFLETARRLPDQQFIMVMTPREPVYFEHTVAEAETIPNLEVLAGVADVRPYYDRAKLLLNVSLTEGFPNTFIEAALSATPIVSLNVDPEGMLSRIGAGVFARGDLEQMIAAVDSLAKDNRRARSMGMRGLEYAREHHDIKVTAEVLKLALADSVG